MIVVMKRGATAEQIEHAIRRVEQLGLKAHPIYGTERTVIAAIGEKRDEFRQSLESGPGVAEVVPILAPYKVASREVKPEPTVVRAGSLAVGNGHVGMIAGPCSVESEEQTLATARAVKAAGATAPARRGVQAAHQSLQLPGPEGGGAEDSGRRPRRDRPGGGDRGDRHRTTCRWWPAMPTCCKSAPATCRTIACWRPWASEGKPVLLKRGPSATLDELLLAAEYILNAGNPNVMLCERGIRTFETHTRFTLPLASVPWLHERTHLPVVVDPSHGTGHTSLVRADGRRRRRRRGRRADRRGPSRSRGGPERRLSVARTSSSSSSSWGFAAE